MGYIISTAFTLFLIINVLGMAPAILVMIKDFTPKRQRIILFREACVALLFILAFSFIGEAFFSWLEVGPASLQIAGGLILFLIALRMIFPHLRAKDDPITIQDEPFIVPIAVPLLAGPATLTTVMIQAHGASHLGPLFAAIFIAWAASAIILLLGPNIKKWIGTRGLNALERLMGLILTLLAVQMMMKGITTFYTMLYGPAVN